MNTQRYHLYGVLCLFLLFLSACGSSSPSQAPSQSRQSNPSQTPTHSGPTPTPTPIQLLANQKSSAGQPVHISIPAIQVDTSIEPVGLTKGDMDTPSQNAWENAGWFKYGTHPGDPGSAVINGHLDRPGGDPAVFWNLKNLKAGDKITVTDSNKATFNFAVQRVVSYSPKEAPLQQIFSKSGGSFLNLITCAGDWIPSEHQTTLRLVVYAEKM